jgi:hypothetical protein
MNARLVLRRDFRSILAAAFLVASLSAPATTFATSSIAIWDGTYPDCFTIDTPGLHTVQVVQRFSVGTLAARFKIVSDPGMTMTYVSETHPIAHSLGNTQDGLSVCYDECMTGTTVVAVITYMGYGTTEPCGKIRVVPHPLAETLDAMNCGGQFEVMTCTHLEVRTTLAGGCNYCVSHMDLTSYPGTAKFFNCVPLPVESGTWGRIKSLYR